MLKYCTFYMYEYVLHSRVQNKKTFERGYSDWKLKEQMVIANAPLV